MALHNARLASRLTWAAVVILLVSQVCAGPVVSEPHSDDDDALVSMDEVEQEGVLEAHKDVIRHMSDALLSMSHGPTKKKKKSRLQIDYSKPCKQPATYVFVVDTRVNTHYLRQAMLDNVCEDFAYEGSSCSISRSTNLNNGISHWDMDAALKRQEMKETKYFLNSKNQRVKDTSMWRKRPHILILLVHGTDGQLKKQVLKTKSLDEEGALCDWQVAVWALGKVPIDPEKKAALKARDRKLTAQKLGLVKYGIKTYEYNTVASQDRNLKSKKLIFPAKLHWLENPQIIMRKIFQSACEAKYQV